ncbi:universal stress protein [Paractinoplanes deccanensis]|uniref:Universal stress protein n=1 Tax=Paractinoplanes deccanensis TaxID=113561 RepID=A0ABQ3YEI9_9ACTN|nr:universal stress protein [Actinoplanes deccanensis]GID78426.1 universal stress protein [Actinoplanes deccanensis]
MSTRKIIGGYDRSAGAQDAATWALDEGRRTGAPVEFLYAYEWPVWAPAASMVPATSVWPDEETDRAIRTMLREAVAAARTTHPDVRTAISIVHASAALTLIDRSAGASLIVLGCRGHSAVAGLLGSVSTAVSAHARCPVVLVRGDAAATAPVVVGVDDSPSSHAAMAFAVEQALARRVPLHVVRAWKPVTGLWEETAMATRTVTATERRPLDELVAAWHEKHPGLEIHAEAVVEHPATALTRAGLGAQLLVVGSRGRGPVRGALLGSVSQHLLRHAACPVAIAHESKA